jgi:aspartate aminotransferase
MSFFANVQEAPPDPILGLNAAFQADPTPNKLNLGVGAYRTEEGKPLVLSCVRKAETKILNANHNKEYLPIDGLADFNRASAKLIFGDLTSQRIVTVQALSGTGALRIGTAFIKSFMPEATMYISDPTWVNHFSICREAGVPYKTYRYFNNQTRQLDFDGMCEDIKNAPSRSVILLHACAHNPTGADPTLEQWEILADIIQEKGHFTFFDCAYQGFASGDLDKDATPIRIFVNRGMEVFCAQSYAKNFGLYGERIGALHVACANEKIASTVLSQLKIIIRAMYSSPPIHGALIVATVLSDPQLYEEWKAELLLMSDRIKLMRRLLYDALLNLGTPGDWTNIINQIGMFSFTGLSADQCDTLTKKYHIYLTKNGRISMPGLSTKTVPYLANAIHDVVTNQQH